MGQLWRWQTGSAGEAIRLLADFAGPVAMPMAHGGRIYFVSDQSGGDAIWSVAEDGSGVRRESEAMPFPIRQASLDGDRIFVQNGADIYTFGITDKSLRKLDLEIVTDRAQTRQRAIEKPLRFLTGATMAPSGQSVAVTARGRVARDSSLTVSTITATSNGTLYVAANDADYSNNSGFVRATFEVPEAKLFRGDNPIELRCEKAVSALPRILRMELNQPKR